MRRCNPATSKEIFFPFHDEVTFSADKNIMREIEGQENESKGAGIMVPDFIDDHGLLIE